MNCECESLRFVSIMQLLGMGESFMGSSALHFGELFGQCSKNNLSVEKLYVTVMQQLT